MPITPLPPAPSRAQPATFSDRGDLLLGALSGFVTEANALEVTVNAAEANAIAQVGLAAAQVALADADVVLTHADVLLTHADVLTTSATANFKGLWTALTGAAVIPYAVSHLGKYWQLAANLADVTTKTPGTDADWLIIPTAMTWALITSDPAPAMAGSGYLCNTTGGAFTVTLPAAPSAGDVISFADAAGTFDTLNLTIGRAALNIMGLGEDMVVSTKYASFSLVYASAALGWRIV